MMATALLAGLAFAITPAHAKGKKGGKGGGGKGGGEPIELGKAVGGEPDMSKPVKVFIMMGQSNMVGMSPMSSLTEYCKTKKMYPYLLDDEGKWAQRSDVRCAMVTCNQHEGPLAPGFGARGIGVELGFGWQVGDFYKEPVLLIKACIGNRSLGWDLLPPGSEPYDGEPGYRGTKENPKGNGEIPAGAGWYAGKQYDDDTANAKAALANLDKYYPGAKNYEVAGFVFWQGEKDHGNQNHMNRYEENLVRFIKALRKDFNSPNAKFVCGTLGESKKGSGDKVMEACFAVDGESGKHPEFKGNVKAVYTNPICNGGSGNGHYGGDAGTYMNVGEAMGKAMVELMKK